MRTHALSWSQRDHTDSILRVGLNYQFHTELITASAVTPAAWRYSPQSFARRANKKGPDTEADAGAQLCHRNRAPREACQA